MPIIPSCYLSITKSPKCRLSDADLNIAQTAWGDSGVYVCSVVSGQDLTGNNEDYTELIVLGKALVVTDTLLLFSLGLPFVCFLRGWMFITPIYAGCSAHTSLFF